eukprot:Colp12_sorted_trinity150504_noHs@33414
MKFVPTTDSVFIDGLGYVSWRFGLLFGLTGLAFFLAIAFYLWANTQIELREDDVSDGPSVEEEDVMVPPPPEEGKPRVIADKIKSFGMFFGTPNTLVSVTGWECMDIMIFKHTVSPSQFLAGNVTYKQPEEDLRGDAIQATIERRKHLNAALGVDLTASQRVLAHVDFRDFFMLQGG